MELTFNMARHLLVMTLTLIALVSTGLNAGQVSIIAHRGASGYLPEHTLPALVLAYSQGADYIEQDLVATKDRKLVVLHDIHLETVTDVEQRFPERKRSDGRYYALDFTLQELQQLSVHERTDQKGNQVFNNRFQSNQPFQISTFEQHIETIAELNRQFSKHVGIYPEVKSPAWHRSQGIDISRLALETLRQYELDRPDSQVYLQCFDASELKRIRVELGAKLKLVQLIGENDWQESDTDYNALRTSAGLAEIATYAQGIGPWLPHVIDPKNMTPTELTRQAHQVGLIVHPYTFRMEQLPPNVSANQVLTMLFEVAKVDGIFTDFTDVVIKHRQSGQP